MVNKFKYDYNNKQFFISFVLGLIFAVLSIVTFEKLIGFVLLLIMAVVALFNAFVVINSQGIKIKNKKNIVIVDYLFVIKLSVDNIKYVTLKQIPKETRSNTYGFFYEFFYPKTYLHHCDYVYNQGRVYDVCFYLKDGTVVKSYFGWLYKEKEKTVNRVEKQLADFVDEINTLCKANKNKNK